MVNSAARSDPAGVVRRRFLALAATGALADVGTTTAQAGSRPRTIRLGGKIGGWQGRAPAAIAGKTNPPLRLETGKKYEIVWENVDGQPHNVVLLDGDGNTLQRTEVIAEQGATQTMEFTAREEMASYICEVHPNSMRGEILFGEETATETESTTTDETEPYIQRGGSVRLETVVDDERLVSPLGFEIPNDDSDRHYIVDRLGKVYVHDDDGLDPEPFIDVSDRLAEISGEMGLLGLAFHPDYRNTRKFYLRYSAPRREGTPKQYSHTEVLVEYEANDSGSSAIMDSERTVLEIPSPQSTHNAGAVVFGPDDDLYMGMGDGGGGGDTDAGHVDDWYEHNDGGNAQDVTENLLGSVLRIDVDGRTDGKPYAIPDDNPLVGEDGLDEHFAWGFRNPWRMSFDDDTLYVADVGEASYEEVDIVEKGNNYGWNVKEGTHCFDTDDPREPLDSCPTTTPPNVRGGESLVDPIIEYPHTYRGRSVGASVIGGHVYGGEDVPALDGKYVFGDFWLNREGTKAMNEYGRLFAATPSQNGLWDLEELTVENRPDGRPSGRPTAFGRGTDGELYVLTQQPAAIKTRATGAVHRIRPPERSRETTSAPTDARTTTRRPDSTERTPTTTGTEASGESGPGFGVLVALGGVAAVAARLFSGRH